MISDICMTRFRSIMNLDRLGNYKMMGNVTNNLKMLVDQSGIGSEVGFFRLTLVQIEDDAASLLELQLRLKMTNLIPISDIS